MSLSIDLMINGVAATLTCEPHETLRTVLRRAGYSSVRYGSDTGETGAAGILVDGRFVSADVMLAVQAEGHSIETVEGLAGPGEMHPIQQAFIDTGAMQSGYSTPAMILAAKELLEQNANPTEADVRGALSGVLDRESGYLRPVHAVLRAAATMLGEDPDDISIVHLDQLLGAEDRPHRDRDGISDIAPRVVPSDDVPVSRIVGHAEAKTDAIKLVKGNPAFTDDTDLSGTLFAKVLYSPHAHARIVSIDDSAARALPGVHAVLHHGNVPRVRYASGGQSYPNPLPYDQVSFDDKVRYVGDRVAAVAADSEEIARAAIDLIDVTYEVLPAVFDENEAILEGAPIIHDEPDMEGAHDASRNIVHHIEAKTGDIDAGLAAAARVFEQTFRVHQVQQTPIEPHIAISEWDSDERLVITTSTQVPFHVRRMVAPLLGLPVKQIRIIKPRIGGGFGAKQEMLIEDIVGHLTMATGRRIRLELTREEEFMSSRTRHPQTITFTTGVDPDGLLTAQQMRIVANTGPYGTHGLTVQMVSGLRGLSSYNSPVKAFDCKVAYTNIPVPGAYRGYGAPQALFALEAHMEDIAADIGMDAIEFRRLNWTKVGDPIDIAPHLGEGDLEAGVMPVITSSGLEEAVLQGKRAVGWERRGDPQWREPPDRPHIRRGLGFAMAMHGTAIPGLDMGGASLKINDDGSFNLLVGATDLGTGSDTVLAQIAAEVVGVGTNDILVYSSDTDMTPFDTGAYASSTTYISGTAVKRAAEQVRAQIIDRAAMLLSADPDTIDLHDGAAWTSDGATVTLGEIALSSLHQRDQHQIMATASYVSPESPPPYAAQFAEVEVDIETGQVTVLQLVMAVDCGVPINPVTASGQVEGGMVQALGYGHCEEMAYDEDGRMVNAAFGPYKIYRADEMPRLEAILVQTMEASGPFGAKAIAEIPKDGVAPALRNAITDATGVRINDIPFTPERVWRALQAS
ncbi:MAG TPA: molybdopterin cofactor-binding domain-containing protein [Acidimicrobiia bacterium]|nr:molybdopterin cofactor-binding domain-containing protein [Acidimicrobiia bacterium]